MYALDTNTLIYFFKGEGRVAARLLNEPPYDISVPVIVLYELYVGICKSNASDRRLQQLGELKDVVTILPFDESVAKEAATIRTALETNGTPIGPLDNLIAGTARANGAVLVTRNLQEFSRVEGLRLENWY